MRKAINFFRSYYEVAKELNDKDRLLFYDALLSKQFDNIDIELKGIVKFAYMSQKHSIDAQLKGYFDKTKDPNFDPCLGGSVGGAEAPSVQEKEEEKEKEQDVKRASENETIKKFTEWFNSRLEKYNGKKGKFKSMTKTDINNLKKLKQTYSVEDFEHAFKQMLKNQWVIDNNKATIDHFLRNDNFVKYLNTEDITPKFKPAWS